MKTQLEILLEQITRQMKVIEEQYNAKTWADLGGYIPNVKNVFEPDPVDPFTIRDADGSYPMVPLLLAKSNVMLAMATLQSKEAM